jgi:hypothetical protein
MTSSLINRIHSTAARSSIDLTILDFYAKALASSAALSLSRNSTFLDDFSYASRMNTHTYPLTPWFRARSPRAQTLE